MSLLKIIGKFQRCSCIIFVPDGEAVVIMRPGVSPVESGCSG